MPPKIGFAHISPRILISLSDRSRRTISSVTSGASRSANQPCDDARSIRFGNGAVMTSERGMKPRPATSSPPITYSQAIAARSLNKPRASGFHARNIVDSGFPRFPERSNHRSGRCTMSCPARKSAARLSASATLLCVLDAEVVADGATYGRDDNTRLRSVIARRN